MSGAQISVLSEASGQRPEPPGPSVAVLSREAAELEYQALVNERSHFEAANYWKTIHFCFGTAMALLGVLTAGSLADYFGDPLPAWLTGLVPDGKATGLFGLTLALLTAASNFFNPSGQQDTHLAVGKRYAAFRTEVRQFRVAELRDGVPVEPIIERLSKFAQRLAEVQAAAPGVGDRYHKRAKAKLASNVHYRELRPLTGRSAPEARRAA